MRSFSLLLLYTLQLHFGTGDYVQVLFSRSPACDAAFATSYYYPSCVASVGTGTSYSLQCASLYAGNLTYYSTVDCTGPPSYQDAVDITLQPCLPSNDTYAGGGAAVFSAVSCQGGALPSPFPPAAGLTLASMSGPCSGPEGVALSYSMFAVGPCIPPSPTGAAPCGGAACTLACTPDGNYSVAASYSGDNCAGAPASTSPHSGCEDAPTGQGGAVQVLACGAAPPPSQPAAAPSSYAAAAGAAAGGLLAALAVGLFAYSAHTKQPICRLLGALLQPPKPSSDEAADYKRLQHEPGE